ncbi:DUF3501 family protein [Sneathiella glossodoripedis]|uniref:DUF3501 family protein n=1 Tax=Sneathiella glossodoripedis TaxID=418853 RepID=UPI000471138C|nr:DUF3501 family protein [Sneathiella glossodoripedis]
MTAQSRKIERSDILPMAEYEKQRNDLKKKLIEIKRDRRVAIGPHATFYFENYDTMWAQVHEMLFIERGGEDQIVDELAAYNPLIPQGKELVATFMIEIDDPVQREQTLYSLGYIEDKIYMSVNGKKTLAVPEMDVDRTTEDGKTSAIHFLHFNLSEDQINAFKKEGAEIIIGIEHDSYAHMTKLNEATRRSLSNDFGD